MTPKQYQKPSPSRKTNRPQCDCAVKRAAGRLLLRSFPVPISVSFLSTFDSGSSSRIMRGSSRAGWGRTRRRRRWRCGRRSRAWAPRDVPRRRRVPSGRWRCCARPGAIRCDARRCRPRPTPKPPFSRTSAPTSSPPPASKKSADARVHAHPQRRLRERPSGGRTSRGTQPCRAEYDKPSSARLPQKHRLFASPSTFVKQPACTQVPIMLQSYQA